MKLNDPMFVNEKFSVSLFYFKKPKLEEKKNKDYTHHARFKFDKQ